VLDRHVRQDLHGGAERGPCPQGHPGSSLQDPLIGQRRVGVHVHPDEVGACGHGHTQGRHGIVAKHIDSQGAVSETPDLPDSNRHGRGHLGPRRSLLERNVPEVLHQEPVESALQQGLRVVKGGIHHLLERPGVTRAAGEGTQVHHPQEKPLSPKEPPCLVQNPPTHQSDSGQ
jgi:hypothetical protein